QKRAHVAADLFGLHRANYTGDAESSHQTNRADGKLGALQDGVVAKDVDFQAAAAEINHATWLRFGAEGGKGGVPAESRFFLGTDDFQADAGGLLDAANEGIAVACFAGSAGGHGSILGDAVLIHEFLEMDEGFDAFFQQAFGEAMTDEDAFAEAQGITLVEEGFDVERGIGASDGEADRVGASVDGGDVNRLRHDGIYRQRCARAEDGVYLETRMPSCSPMRWRNCLLTAETLASPSSSMKAFFLAMLSSSRLIMVW